MFSGSNSSIIVIILILSIFNFPNAIKFQNFHRILQNKGRSFHVDSYLSYHSISSYFCFSNRLCHTFSVSTLLTKFHTRSIYGSSWRMEKISQGKSRSNIYQKIFDYMRANGFFGININLITITVNIVCVFFCVIIIR